MSQSDPTLAALAKMRDPRFYTKYENIPIFCAHTRKVKSKDGKEIEIKVTDKDLEEIAKNAQGLIEYEGVPLRITDGHTKPDPKLPESEQPGFFGWGLDPHVGEFGPEKKKAVLVTQYIRNEKVPFLKEGNRPFRSSEYYPPSKSITGIALLMRDPFLNLGVVDYQGERTPYLYAMDNAMPEPATPPATPNEEFSPEEVQHFEKLCRYMQMKGYMAAPAAAAAPAGPGTAGGGNSYVPGSDSGKKPDDQMNNSRNGDPVLYAKVAELERSNAALAKANAAMLEKDQRKECADIINALVTVEHYMLKPEKEISRMLTMTAAERQEHVAYIREHYNQTPDASRIPVYNEGRTEGGVRPPQTTEAEMKAAVTEATRMVQYEGVDERVAYDQALLRVRNGTAGAARK